MERSDGVNNGGAAMYGIAAQGGGAMDKGCAESPAKR